MIEISVVGSVILGGLIVGFLVGLKFDNWLRETWAMEMIKRLDVKNEEIVKLKEAKDTYRELLGSAQEKLQSQRDWPEIIG